MMVAATSVTGSAAVERAAPVPPPQVSTLPREVTPAPSSVMSPPSNPPPKRLAPGVPIACPKLPPLPGALCTS